MKKLLGTVTLILMISSAASAATTKEGYFACLSEEWLDDLISFLVAEDYASAQAYVDQQKCIQVKGGLKVTILDAGWTKHQFAYKGLKFWTVAEGLNVN